MAAKRNDLVVFGATRFVGQILCRYLLEQFGVDGKPSWARAGRSMDKLEQVRSSLGRKASRLPLLVADASDEDSLRQLCAEACVIVSTVGPYALYGEPLVKVCAETGTDYCDLTGEVQWIRRMIRSYEPRAKKSGARIVHCCGFDSIPSDLGVYFLQQACRDRHGKPCTTVKMRVKSAKGGFSGGTVASLMNVLKEASSDPKLRKELANPYSLCPKTHAPGVRQAQVTLPEYDADFESWVAPFVMAGINTRIVHRSNALAKHAYGKNFRYDEAVLTGPGLKGRLVRLHRCAPCSASSCCPSRARDRASSSRRKAATTFGSSDGPQTARRCGPGSPATGIQAMARPRRCWARRPHASRWTCPGRTRQAGSGRPRRSSASG